MADILEFLDRLHPVYAANQEAYKRDERRLSGGDDVLDELVKWKGEDDTHFNTVRRPMAGYLPFPEAHASTLSGHLNRKYPQVNYGSLGEVRTREEIDTPQLAELFDYNADGIGQDGTQLQAYLDAVEQRAIATGHRWLMMEMPSRETLRQIRLNATPPRNPDTPEISPQDQLDGFRPYLVERLLSVKNWRIDNGVLQYAVIREPLPTQDDLVNLPVVDAYYLLVRKGYPGLGDPYSEGGWWWFDSEKKPISNGRWLDTRGQIPMWILFGRRAVGTISRPSISRSLTMELGQIAVGLMNLRSTRDYNLIQAGKSINYIMGGDDTTQQIVAKQHEDASIVVTVPPITGPDGRAIVPALWNSSEAAVASGAFKAVIESGIAEAKEIMVRQVTAALDQSGVSRTNAFNEAVSPLLANLAGNREVSDNTMLYFLALRFGKEPDGSVTWPREFPINDLVEDITKMVDAMRRASISSPTFEADLMEQLADKLGLMPEEKRAKILGEWGDAVKQKAERKAQMDALAAQLGALPPEPPTGNGAPSSRIPAETGAGA
jgi:hypothetical protein